MTKITTSVRNRYLVAALISAGCISPAYALAAENSAEINIEITSSKVAKELDKTPSSISVISGKDLRDRNATDLRTALSLVAGVDVAPGGDAGPASSAPGMWGLREFDAFLLVVDGVPWGGAFNPALTSLSLNNVDRIEVQRGAAPVMYGATSFIGVIHVIHNAAGEASNEVSGSIGNHHTVGASVSANLPKSGAVNQSIYLDVKKQQFSQNDSKLDRGHLLYRASADLDIGKAHLDLDATRLQQKPYSPHPREGSVLTTRFPLDANINPRDGKANENRVQLNAGLDSELGFGKWSTLFSVGHASNENVRGFLREDFEVDGVTHNADGYRQNVSTDSMYFDTHLVSTLSKELTWTVGMDWLYGKGTQHSDNFEYGVLPNGANSPNSTELEIDESTRLTDKRNFAGVYTQLDWKASDRWDVIAGMRYNDTRETRSGTAIDHHAPSGELPETSGSSRNKSGLSGSLATNYVVWSEGRDQASAFINYRSTYKPAAIDFGPEAEGQILQAETAKSTEAGLKGHLMNGRFSWGFSTFRMNFKNLVIRENINGLPGLSNAGTELFKGSEIEGSFRMTGDFRVSASYARHDARFVDYARLRPDGSIQQLGGKFLELSPRNLGAIGFVYAPQGSFQASLVLSHVGERFLNKGNSSVAAAYNVLDAGIGVRVDGWSLRLDGTNLNNTRAPVAESEIGDAQFYRMPGRSLVLSARTSF
ncbi:MAG: TonB-dependent receptor [Pseudomonadota bacterium]